MEFNSQICTTDKQSRRLITLGLKKETADCALFLNGNNEFEQLSKFGNWENYADMLPAWSLHRLIEMIQTTYIRVNLCGWWVQIERKVYNEEYYGNAHNNLYDNLIDCIKRLIEDNRFNKEYLEE